jgi:hypothetical protein
MEIEFNRERMEAMFRSNQPEMMKLARLICHRFRVDYYVICRKIPKNKRKKAYKWKPIYMSLNRIVDKFYFYEMYGPYLRIDKDHVRNYKLGKIRLNNATKIKNK